MCVFIYSVFYRTTDSICRISTSVVFLIVILQKYFKRSMHFCTSFVFIDCIYRIFITFGSNGPQIRNYAPNMIQKRKESASLVKRGHSASNVTIKTYKCPYPTMRLEAIRKITTISCRCYPKSFWNTLA